MTTNLFDELNCPDSADDPHLNQLLSEARWPEPDARSLARLQSVASSVLSKSISPGAGSEKSTAEPVFASGRRRPRLQSLVPVTAFAVALLIAFLAGRWTSPDSRGSVAETQRTSEPASIPNPAAPVGVSPMNPVPKQHTSQMPNLAAMDASESKPSLPSFSPEEPKLVQPQPDPLSEKRRRLTQREKLQLQLDSVLACLEAGVSVDASCCQSLLPRRAEFEFLLAEVIRNTTGQRQLAAVTALGFVGTDGSVPELLQSASSESLRTAAVNSVKRCSSEQMLAALVLKPGNQTLAEEYVKELAHRSTQQAAFAWLHLMRSSESRDLCLGSADDLSPELVNILFAELDAPLMDDRMAAILSLGRRADEQTLQRVTQLCQQYPGRWEPVAILMWNGSKSAINTLTVLQKTPERYAVLQTASIQLNACLGPHAATRAGGAGP